MALAHVAHALGADEARRRMAPVLGDEQCRALLSVMGRAQFSPLTSSCGRLFDAVASLLGVRHKVTYEGQAACELEAICARGEEEIYEFDYDGDAIRVAPLVAGVCRDIDAGVDRRRIAARFHNSIAAIIIEACVRLCRESGLRTVGLSGGVMHNNYLLDRAVPALEREGFEVLLHQLVPPGDGGICLGQVACAIARVTGPND